MACQYTIFLLVLLLFYASLSLTSKPAVGLNNTIRKKCIFLNTPLRHSQTVRKKIIGLNSHIWAKNLIFHLPFTTHYKNVNTFHFGLGVLGA